MSKVIVISDVHLHRWQYGSTVTSQGYNSRLVSQFGYLHSLATLAAEEDAKHIICLGDFFHTNQTIHAEVLSTAANILNYFASKGINFHCLVGNHDMASKDGSIHLLEWMKQYGYVVDKPGILNIEGRKIAALPYTEDRNVLSEFLKYRAEEIVLLHQGINLANRGSAWVINEIFEKEMVPEQVKRVLTGHYHKPCNDGKISIVGSTMEHTWSDYDGSYRGCIILDLDTTEIKRIRNKYSPTFSHYDCKMQASNVNNCFIKVYNCPKEKIDQLRNNLLEDGALSVEFNLPEIPIVVNDNSTIKSKFATIEEVISEYDSLTDGRQRQIGQLIREKKYEAPTFSV